VRKHYVKFLSPGTFYDEDSSRPIREWDTREAMRMANSVTERHGSIPYAFQFETYLDADPVPDGEGGTLEVRAKRIATSGLHYIKGRVLNYVEATRSHGGTALPGNMRGNRWPLVCETVNKYSHVGIYGADDCIVSADGDVTDRGDSAPNKRARSEQLAQWEQP
jgi:hypothetical protein